MNSTPTRTKINNKNSNNKSVSNSSHTHQEFPQGVWWVWRLSMCNPYTYLSVPVWRTYNTCVLWSAISNMNQWNTNGFWTGIMILYVYKKQKLKQKNTKSLDICCTLNGLFILNFVSIGVLKGYKVQRWTFLCVCESISKVSTATTGSSGYSLKQMIRLCLSRSLQCELTTLRTVGENTWMLIYPTHSAKRNHAAWTWTVAYTERWLPLLSSIT